MRSRVIALTALATVAVAAAAEAKVVPQSSIAGVRLGVSADDVVATLGEPRSRMTMKDEIQGSILHLDYGLTNVYLDAAGERVQTITTRSRKERTAKDVGIGSTVRTVRAKVKGVRCSGGVCTVGKLEPGRTVTSFHYGRSGKVDRVSLGLVID